MSWSGTGSRALSFAPPSASKVSVAWSPSRSTRPPANRRMPADAPGFASNRRNLSDELPQLRARTITEVPRVLPFPVLWPRGRPPCPGVLSGLEQHRVLADGCRRRLEPASHPRGRRGGLGRPPGLLRASGSAWASLARHAGLLSPSDPGRPSWRRLRVVITRRSVVQCCSFHDDIRARMGPARCQRDASAMVDDAVEVIPAAQVGIVLARLTEESRMREMIRVTAARPAGREQSP